MKKNVLQSGWNGLNTRPDSVSYSCHMTKRTLRFVFSAFEKLCPIYEYLSAKLQSLCSTVHTVDTILYTHKGLKRKKSLILYNLLTDFSHLIKSCKFSVSPIKRVNKKLHRELYVILTHQVFFSKLLII